jgi:hypothetical protein
LLLFANILIVMRKKAKESANLALMRNRKASKIARKHLKAAHACVKERQRTIFEALLKAFWGYIATK